MLKQGGEWKTVDWQTALEYVANGLKQIKADHGAQQHRHAGQPAQHARRAATSPPSLMRGLGSDNIDYRLRNAEFITPIGMRWLGTSIASLSQLQRAFVVGSNLRKDHPLFAQRIRQAVRKGAALKRSSIRRS
jgi:NADH-quinone oxidoreductase subunit G